MEQTITLTFGDMCENHAGMQKIGKLYDHGLNLSILQKVQRLFPEQSEIINLHYNDLPAAHLLIVRGGVNLLLNGKYSELLSEQSNLKPDTKALMRGRVVNKRARHNLCFGFQSQVADIANGKGTIVAYDKTPLTLKLKNKLEKIFEVNDLQCEGNYYYDVSQCGIGYHGDTERKVVIGVRLGADMLIKFRWFQKFIPINTGQYFNLDGGDIYAMSEKAVGFDWKHSSIPTLRHCAGRLKYIEKEDKRVEKEKKNT